MLTYYINQSIEQIHWYFLALEIPIDILNQGNSKLQI